MNDVAAVLRGFADDQRLAAEGAAPESVAEVGGLVRRVRRRRAFRAGGGVLSAFAVGGALVVAAQVAGIRTPPPALPVPTATSAPAPSQVPTPSQSPTPSPTSAPETSKPPTFRDALPLT